MRILIYRWKSYTQFDMIEELRRRGHEVFDFQCEMSNYEEDGHFAEVLRGKLDEVRPELVVSSNYFSLISDECEQRGIRYLSWCCDSPISTMYHESIRNSKNTVFQFDMTNQLEFKAMGAPVYYLPLCSAVDRVDALLNERKVPDILTMDSYISDVTFIGSMYRKNMYDDIADRLSEYRRGYFDAALKMQMNAYGMYLLDDILDGETLADLERHFILAKTERSFADLNMTFATTVLSYKIAQMERQAVIAKLSERFAVNVYTDDGTIDFVKATRHKTVDYWSEAPEIYRRSKINLNLTLRSIQSGIPLRVWDILGAGGFLITNYQPELGLYFEQKKDLVYFEDLDDLAKLVEYYLEHEEERKQIAANGYRKVKELHQYRNRFDAMRQWIPEI